MVHQHDYLPTTMSESAAALRPLPHNLDAESSVLSALLLSPSAVEEVVISLKPQDFYRPANRRVYEAIVELSLRGTPVDALSVADRLQAKGELEEIGGRSYLIDLSSNTLSMVNWLHHVEIIKRNSILRDLIGASSKISELAFSAPDELDDVVEESERLLLNVTNERIESNFIRLDSLLEKAYNDIEAISQQGEGMIGVPTGFLDLDKRLAGLRGGNLVILAARPAVGKTSFALNMAINAAKAGIAVAFFSLEMSAAELAQRVLCSEAQVDLHSVRTGNLRPIDWTCLIETSQRLASLDFWVDDTPGTTVLEIRAKARRQLHNKEKGIVFVDYLQLMNPQGRFRSENRNVEVGEMSRGLKILAKDLDMPVVALSQLSRAVESRSDKRPMLSDLRESGSIEQDADIVMFLDRSTSLEESKRENRPDEGVANLIIAKNRAGATADIPLTFIGKQTRFQNFSSDNG